jgi:hypothetical protein
MKNSRRVAIPIDNSKYAIAILKHQESKPFAVG